MSRMRHASDFKIDELRNYIARARVSTVQRLLDEELAAAKPRPKAVDALEARLQALGAPLPRDAAMAGAAPESAEVGAFPAAAPVTTAMEPQDEDVALAPEPEAEDVALVPEQEAGEGAGPVTDKAQSAAQDLAGQAREKGQEVTARAQDRVREQVNERSTQAGDQVGSIALALRRLADDLRNEGQEWAAKLADQGAQKAEQLAGYLREVDAERALRDLNDFARSKPQAVVAGGLALGFAASRLVKASRGGQAGEEAGEPLPAREEVDLAEEPMAASTYPEPAYPEAPAEDVLPEPPDAALTPGERARALAYGEGGTTQRGV